jgi:hypothetical protein
VFVIVGILNLLTPVAQVPEDADTVLNTLVINVGSGEGAADDVEQGLDQPFTLP